MQLKKQTIFWSTLFCATLSWAATPATTKSYTLTDLQRVVSNSENCKPLYKALKKATQHPLVFQFAAQPNHENIAVTDPSNQITSHNYSILKQDIRGTVVHRIGTGTFMLNQQLVDYVIDVSADTSDSHFHYIYPIILLSDNAHCYYTGLIHPDATTVSTFKQNIAAGAVAQKTDLYSAKK